MKYLQYLRTYIIVAALGLALGSCAQNTAPTATDEAAQPAAVQAENSETAADVTAAAVGTESGGAGEAFLDALTLAHGGAIDGAVIKSAGPLSNDTLHVVTVTRTKTTKKVTASTTWTHTWIYYDANGVAMPNFVKGVTDKVMLSSYAQRSLTNPKITMQDSARGNWVISQLIAHPDSVVLNGTFTRFAENTHLKNGKTMRHEFTINFTNDILAKGLDKDEDEVVAYLLGSANSDLKVSKYDGKSFERQVAIAFHGDGTATLTITRISADGKVDIITVDARKGLWLRDDRIG
jgi:hypothetical protein